MKAKRAAREIQAAIIKNRSSGHKKRSNVNGQRRRGGYTGSGPKEENKEARPYRYKNPSSSQPVFDSDSSKPSSGVGYSHCSPSSYF